MEELRSTDILDQEIRSDVKKRADKILEKGKESSEKLLSDVKGRIEAARRTAEKESEERLSLFEKNIKASLPLEEERYLVSYVYSQVVGAMNSYFTDMGAQGRLEVIKKLVERAESYLGQSRVNVFCIDMEVEKAEAFLKKEFGDRLLSCQKYQAFIKAETAVEGFIFKDGIIIETEDSSILCRLTLDEKVKEILDSNLFELSQTLFSGRLAQ